jgi:hypothetical protein
LEDISKMMASLISGKRMVKATIAKEQVLFSGYHPGNRNRESWRDRDLASTAGEQQDEGRADNCSKRLIRPRGRSP